MNAIKKSTLDFLKNLKVNNNREWFNANRKLYDEAKEDYESFIQAIIDEIVKFDPILKGLEVKSCTYRLNRDIRFSPDKTIYKTHLGAFIVKGGKKNGDKFAGYYVHVEPGGSMIAGGAYLPPSQWLSAIREKINDDGDKLVRIIKDKEFVANFKELEGETLKTAPKGYPKDHKYIELLRMKSFLVSRMISDKDICSQTGFDTIIKGCKAMKPLNDFMNDY
jgi:uncharacterized protein (TIGR02453 family)